MYADWQKLEGFQGEGELVEFISEGLPFILKDSKTNTEPVYAGQTWIIQTKSGLIRKTIRVFKWRGVKKQEVTIKNEWVYADTFLVFDGKEIY